MLLAIRLSINCIDPLSKSSLYQHYLADDKKPCTPIAGLCSLSGDKRKFLLATASKEMLSNAVLQHSCTKGKLSKSKQQPSSFKFALLKDAEQG